jgi:Phospholipase_D-nuclease N-terminal
MSFWDVIVSIFWFMLLVAWIWLLISILADIFRDHELSGWGKALWTLFIIVLPWLGAVTYLIARGRSMNERSLAQAERQDHAFRRYVRCCGQPTERGRGAGEVGGPPGTRGNLGAGVRAGQGAAAGHRGVDQDHPTGGGSDDGSRLTCMRSIPVAASKPDR